MASRNYATRMSCFSLIASIEADLRSVISNYLDEDDSLLPDDVIKIAKERYFDHKKEIFSTSEPISDLIDFIDFYDLSKILYKIGSIPDIFSIDDIKFISNRLETLSKCRNRVCHSRPLEQNDFTDLLDFTHELIIKGDRFIWKNINEAINNLDNPSFALSLEIPDFWKADTKSIFHNLPLPEFDDTGFMGRDIDRKAINKLLTSNTSVISIVGEGGIGKTALAQRCLYDILELCELKDASEPIYDIIIWVSLKTKKLTINGINQIQSAINSSSGMFHNVSKALGADTIANTESALGEILEYMSEFKTLLCIDNLETISSSEVREFLADIPSTSKILITTRVGLGEIEYRYKLDKLDDKASMQLMRNMSRLLNLDDLYKKKSLELKKLCKRLYNNPLLIKWYVLAVASGKSPAELLNKQSANFKEVLKFCFENLYDQLSAMETKVISVIACMHKPISAVELRYYLSDTPEIEIEEALNQLHNSSMLVSSTEQEYRLYSLTGVADEYISTIRPVSDDVYQLVKNKRKELQSILDKGNIIKHHYKYDLNSIVWKNRDEKICSTYLKKAQAQARAGDLDTAEKYVIKAKEIMPHFSECYRVHGHVIRDRSPFKAEVELEKAIDCDPDSAIVRYSYAQLLIHSEDFERAYEQINHALRIDPDEIAFKTSKAWILTLRGDYKSAASIYEYILPQQDSRLRKFRISTYDQAISCYRRMAEQYIRDNDFDEAKIHLSHALDVFENAINNNDYDNGLIKKLCVVLRVIGDYNKRSGDNSLILEIFTLIETNIEVFPVSCMPILKNGLEEYDKHYHLSECNKSSYLLSKIDLSINDIPSNRIIGSIDKVSQGSNGVSYGFINGSNNKRYFFLRSELSPNNLLDNGHDNKNVSFQPGEYDRGICALNIKEL